MNMNIQGEIKIYISVPIKKFTLNVRFHIQHNFIDLTKDPGLLAKSIVIPLLFNKIQLTMEHLN